MATQESLVGAHALILNRKVTRTPCSRMPPGKVVDKRKYRPSTAPGVLQSQDVKDLLEDLRPLTAPGKNLLGLDPTYITSRHHVPGAPVTSKFKGRQVHGGLPEPDHKGTTKGRRGTLGGLEDIQKHELDRQRRPATAVNRAMAVKVIFSVVFPHHSSGLWL